MEMNDKEILDVVYQTLKASKVSSEKNTIYESRLVEDMLKFVEEEWQKQDELLKREAEDAYTEQGFSSLDVVEIERHRGLEIGPDGTVESIE
tara:strand:+ start:361 stop:636 length:276 start_codon:yes stop_codon:yes gene_type:complete